jgi:hypothetical protein
MGLRKGQTNNPDGRPKGSLNKVPSRTREAFNKLIEDNLDNMSIWLAEVAAEDPKAALDVVAKLSEYIVPKLARTETTLETKDKKIFEVKIKK